MIPASSPQSQSVFPIEIVEGFEFKFEACSRQAQSINCELMINNTKEDRTLGLDAAQTKIFSSEKGYVLEGKMSQFGTSEARRVIELIPTNIPVRATIIFEEIPPDLHNISAMTIQIWRIADTYTDKIVKFQSKKQLNVSINP